MATSFGNIRGLAPEDPTKQGGYYSASVAYYGHETDLNAVAGDQKANDLRRGTRVAAAARSRSR